MNSKDFHIIVEKLVQNFMYIPLSLILVFLVGRIFSNSLLIDSMTFKLQRKKKTFKVKEHWAGDLPDQAQEILDLFSFPDIYHHFQTSVPKGILLHGLPGTGKTHFARLIADLTDSEFFAASASQFDEVFVGKGAQRVRNLFEEAKRASSYTYIERLYAFLKGVKLPQKRAVIFIDELDAIGSRTTALGSIHSPSHATVSQLLTCLDGLDERGNIFVIAATNNIAQIDPAIRRSGRFDRVIEMPMPNEHSRLALILFYLNNKPGVDKLSSSLENFAKITEGFSSADLKNLASEAVMDAVQDSIKKKKENNPNNVNDVQHFTVLPENCNITVKNLEVAYNTLKLKLKHERGHYL